MVPGPAGGDGNLSERAVGRLVPIDRFNWRRALAVRVSPDQLPQVADHQPVALVILAKAQVAEGGWEWEPLAWEVDDGALVAVAALAHDGPVAQLLNLAVDHRHQRRGVGTRLVASLIEHARSRGSSLLALTVHPDNQGAMALYRSLGFVDSGTTQHGEPVWTLRLG